MSRTKRRRSQTNEELTAATMGTLVRHARTNFGRLGYERASVERIAAQAGVSKGAVYYHFGDKPGLFEAVFRDAQAEIVRRVNDRAEQAPDAITAVLSGCEAFVEVALDDDLRKIVLSDAPRVLGWATWRQIDLEFGLGSLEEGLRAAEQEGARLAAPAGLLCHLLSGAMNEGVFLIAEAQNREEAFGMVVEGLRAVVVGSMRASRWP